MEPVTKLEAGEFLSDEAAQVAAALECINAAKEGFKSVESQPAVKGSPAIKARVAVPARKATKRHPAVKARPAVKAKPAVKARPAVEARPENWAGANADDFIAAAAVLFNLDKVAYGNLRQDLKKKPGVKVTEWDAEVKKVALTSEAARLDKVGEARVIAAITADDPLRYEHPFHGPLYRLNDEFGFITDEPGASVVRKTTGKIFSVEKFLRVAGKRRLEVDGKTKLAAPIWMNWEGRDDYHSVVIEPGNDGVIVDDDGRHLNTYRPRLALPLDPESIAQYNEDLRTKFFPLLAQVFNGRPWGWRAISFLQRHARILRNPGQKTFGAWLFVGGEGIGKTLLLQCIQAGYAPYAPGKKSGTGSYSLAYVLRKFNASLLRKEYLIVNELLASGASKRAMNNDLKNLLDRDAFEIEYKGVDPFPVRDFINCDFTSNDDDSLHMKAGIRRRFMVHKILGQLLEQQQYDAIGDWRRTLAAHFAMRYLLEVLIAPVGLVVREPAEADDPWHKHLVDAEAWWPPDVEWRPAKIYSYNPTAPMPATEEKRNMEADSDTSTEAHARRMIQIVRQEREGTMSPGDLTTMEAFLEGIKADPKDKAAEGVVRGVFRDMGCTQLREPRHPDQFLSVEVSAKMTGAGRLYLSPWIICNVADHVKSGSEVLRVRTREWFALKEKYGLPSMNESDRRPDALDEERVKTVEEAMETARREGYAAGFREADSAAAWGLIDEVQDNV